MIKRISELDIALDFVAKVYMNTIYKEDSINGQKNFISNYVYGDETLANFKNKIEEYYGYYLNDKLVGVVSLSNNGYIKFLFVDKNIQGNGIGKKLLMYVIAIAQKRQIEIMTLDSSIRNVDFYKKYGFIPASDPICKDDIWFIPMIKDLSKEGK
ncbi:MAG: GNAT family N-acetyltransferase [Anaeroplasma sp.]